jgi:gluconate 5-dehydrogenase
MSNSSKPEDHVLITGGGTGLGFGIAQSFVAAGAKVTITGRREQPLAEACESLGDSARYTPADITRDEDRRRLIEEASAAFGPVTTLVNNAGTHLKHSLEEMEISDFDAVLTTHLSASVALSQLLVPGMKDRKEGHLLFIASMASYLGLPNVAAYSAAKAGVLGVVRSLAVELGPAGIRVNAIAPGWIETPMLHRALDGDPARRDKILSRTPMARFGEPSDIGAAAVYLSSEQARFVTGVALPVDGGALIGF